MKDALGKKNIPILKGSSAYLILILWCNVKLKCIIHKGNCQYLTFCSFDIVYVDCSPFSLFLYAIIYNTQQKFLPILSEAAFFFFLPILMSFTFGHTHPGIVRTKSHPTPYGGLTTPDLSHGFSLDHHLGDMPFYDRRDSHDTLDMLTCKLSSDHDKPLTLIPVGHTSFLTWR